jgi:hypothetical protein
MPFSDFGSQISRREPMDMRGASLWHDQRQRFGDRRESSLIPRLGDRASATQGCSEPPPILAFCRGDFERSCCISHQA